MKLLNFRLTDNVHWLVDDIKNHMKSLKKVDSQIHETGNEGCDWHMTCVTSALVIHLCKDPERGTKKKFSLDHTGC